MPPKFWGHLNGIAFMGFTVNWHKFDSLPDVDGNFTILEPELSFLDFGAQYGDDPDRFDPPKHVVGLRFQGTSAYNIRAWIPSTRAEIIPFETKKSLPRVEISDIEGSLIRHETYIDVNQSTPTTLPAVEEASSADPYAVFYEGIEVNNPEQWTPSLTVDGSEAWITFTPPVNTRLGEWSIYFKDQETEIVYKIVFQIVDAVFKFHGCRATDEDTYTEAVSSWPKFPNNEIQGISLLDAPLNKQFMAYSQPLGIGAVVPSVVQEPYEDITIQNIRIMAAFDTDDQP